MAGDIATIGLEVGADGVVRAVGVLEGFVQAAEKADKANEALAAGGRRASSAMSEEARAALEAARAQQQITKALQSADSQRYSLIEGLHREIATFGMSKTQIAEYQAAILGVTHTVAPLVAELGRLRTEQEAATQAQREAAATQAAVTTAIQSADSARYNLIEGLREEISTFGMSSTELLQYRARLLGVSSAIDPLLAKLNELRSAEQARAAAQAAADAAAAREAQTLAMVRAALESVDSSRYALIEGLREQIATFGLSSAELIKYRASLLGVSSAVDPLIAELERLQAAQAAANDEIRASSDRVGFITSLRDETALLGKSRSEVVAYRAAQMGLSNEAELYVQRLREHEQAQERVRVAQVRGANVANQYGKTQREVAQAMRLLPAQITDIVTSLISGQPAYLVAIQQGGQLKDSFGGIVPAVRALIGAINPVTGLLLAGGAAAAVFAAGLLRGTQEATNFNRALILTGNYAGTTSDRLQEMAERLSDLSGVSRGDASSALTLLVSNTRASSDELERFARVALEAQENLGVSVETTVKNFAELGKDPVQASLKLNESMHYLTAEVVAQMLALEKQGNQTDLSRLAMEAYFNTLDSLTDEAVKKLSSIELAWRQIKDAIEGASNVTGVSKALSPFTFDYKPLGASTAVGENISGTPQMFPGLGGDIGTVRAAANKRANDEAVAAEVELNRIRTQSLSKQEQLTAAYAQYDKLIMKTRAVLREPSQEQQATDRAAIYRRIMGEPEAQDFSNIGASQPFLLEDALRPLQERIDGERNLLKQSLDQMDEYHAAVYEAELDAERRQKRVADATAEYRRQQIDDLVMQSDAIAGVFGMAGEAAAAFGKKGFAAFKALKIAEALIAIPSTAIKAYESALAVPVIGPGLAPVAAATAVAFQLAQVAQIRSAQYTGYESGGLVSGGEQLIRINERGQEFVVNAEATQRYRGLLEQMNSGAQIYPSASGGTSTFGTVNITYNDNVGVAVSTRMLNDGQIIAEINHRVSQGVDVAVGRSAVVVGASLGSRSGAAWDGLQAGSVVRPRPTPSKVRG